MKRMSNNEGNGIDEQSEKLLELEIEFLKRTIYHFMENNMFDKVEKTAKELQDKKEKLRMVRLKKSIENKKISTEFEIVYYYSQS